MPTSPMRLEQPLWRPSCTCAAMPKPGHKLLMTWLPLPGRLFRSSSSSTETTLAIGPICMWTTCVWAHRRHQHQLQVERRPQRQVLRRRQVRVLSFTIRRIMPEAKQRFRKTLRRLMTRLTIRALMTSWYRHSRPGLSSRSRLAGSILMAPGLRPLSM
jgi:hypothetical protein